MSLFAELKRRNVFRVAAAYVIIGWLVMQVGEVMAPALHLPGWVTSALAFFIILGFPFAMFFAWAFEMTPQGLKREKEVARAQSITPVTGRKLDFMIIGLLAAALAWFAWDRFGPRQETPTSTVAESVTPAPVDAAAEPADPSIAVLPFVNMSSDPEQDYFSDGLSEELLNLLAKVPQLQVAARTSSFSFKGQNLEIREIAQKLGVAHVLEGSVRKSGDQVRITAQLIRADNGFHLWSETWDRTLENIFTIQDEIAAHVVEALRVTLLGETPTVAETDTEAYQLFLQGRHFALQRSGASLAKAIELFRQAVAIDPDYAPAWGELAYATLWYAGIGGMPIEEGNRLGNEAIEGALAADPELALAHLSRGLNRVYYQFDFPAGIADFQRAWELEPGNALVVGSLASGHRVMGRFNEALELARMSVRLDPVLPEAHDALGHMNFVMRRWDEAEAAYLEVLELSPAFTPGHMRLGRVYLARGEPERALAQMQLEVDSVYGAFGLALAYQALGDGERAQVELDRLVREKSDTAAYQIAEIHAQFGNDDGAFEWLEHARVIGDSGLGFLLGDPAFDSLLDDPRWAEFLQRMKLYEAWLVMPPEWGGPQP